MTDDVGKLVKEDDGYHLKVEFGMLGQQPYDVKIKDGIAIEMLKESIKVVEQTKVDGELPELNKQRVLGKLRRLLG
jgi:hypothetical protein